MPGHTDFVIAHSTVAGFYSWRNTVQGSWYIQAMTKVLAKERQERDLLSMLTNVNKVRNCIGWDDDRDLGYFLSGL